MSKKNFKIITAAITIVHLGGNDSAWGMLGKSLDDLSEKEGAITKARHQYPLPNSNEHSMDSHIDVSQELFPSASTGATHLPDVKFCAACQNNVDSRRNYEEDALQDLLFKVQEMDKRVQEMDKRVKNLEDAGTPIQKQQQREQEESQRRADMKELKTDEEEKPALEVEREAAHPLEIQSKNEEEDSLEVEREAAKALANQPKDEEEAALGYTWRSAYGLLGVIPLVTSRKIGKTKH